MVPPEQPEDPGATVATATPLPTAGLPAPVRALLGATAIGIGGGAFFASLVLDHRDRLAAGCCLDALAWRGSSWPWAAAIGLGVALVVAFGRTLRGDVACATSRAVLVAAALGLSSVRASLDLTATAQPWLHALLGLSLGMVAAGCGPALRHGTARLATALGAFVAGGGAVAGVEYGSADLCGAVAMGACLLAGVCIEPTGASRSSRRDDVTALVVAAGALCLVALASLPPAWLAAFLVLSLIAVMAGRVGIVLGAAAVLTGGWWLAAPQPRVAAGEVLLAQRGSAAVIYGRSNQQLSLVQGDRLLVAFGPDRTEATLAAALLTSCARAGDRVLLVGAGGERLGQDLPAAAPWLVERLVDDRDLGTLPARLCADGPVPPAAGVATPPPWRDTPGPLAALGSGTRQWLVVAEDALSAGAHRRCERCQAELRRIAGDGFVLQLLGLDRAAPQALLELFDAAVSAHRWNGLYLVGDGAVLLSGAAPPVARGDFASWRDDERWLLHRAHLGGPADLDQAFAGTVLAPPPTQTEPEDLTRVLLLRLAPAAAIPTGDSLLLRWLRSQSDQRRARARLLALPDDIAGRAEAQALTAPFLPVGAPQPWLQAALALPDADGGRLADPGRAVRAATALDPTFFDDAPAVFASLPRPRLLHGDLEDLWQLGDRRRLAERCAGDSTLAVALRARFGSRCARALVAALVDGPLTTDQNLALRELADAFVLEEAARIVLPAGRWPELLGWWRLDLPVPQALADVAGLAVEHRVRLAAALRGRREPTSQLLLAELLDDDDRMVRAVAGEVLEQLHDGAIPFDADWPRSERLDAAARLRELHNRRP